VPSETIHIPEVVEPDENLPVDLLALRKFAWYMDQAFAIPGTTARVGISSILGLVPWAGDLAGSLLSMWIVAGALRHRVPARIIAAMVFNIAVDLIFGSIPVAGDIFDFLYEENMKNMRLLEAHRDRRRPPRSAARIALIVAAIIAFLIMLAILLIAALIAAVIWLIGQRGWF
jgi:hypothetical protein